MHIGELSAVKLYVTEKLKGHSGITAIGESKTHIVVYVLNSSAKQSILGLLGDSNKDLIQVIVTGSVKPAED